MSDAKKDIAKEKWKQYIIENSSEIKELHRHLQTAYNRHMLQVKIETDRANLEREKVTQKNIYEEEKRLYKNEELRLQKEQEQQNKAKQMFASELKQQMCQKKQREREEFIDSVRHANDLEERLKNEQLQEQKRAEEAKLEKDRLHKEQEAFCELQRTLKEQEREQLLNMQKELQTQVNLLAIRDAELVHRRKQKLDASEVIKDKLFANLEALSKAQKEQEELAIRLMCAEKDKKEQEYYEEEMQLLAEKREALKQKYEDITRDKLEEIAAMKQLERERAEDLRIKIERSVEVEKKLEHDKRRVRTAVRLDNWKLFDQRIERNKADIQNERSIEKAIETDEDNRMKVVQDERLRLLKSLEKPFLEHLPRGCLDEEDLLNLNWTGEC